jgi:hypothetical protein
MERIGTQRNVSMLLRRTIEKSMAYAINNGW